MTGTKNKSEKINKQKKAKSFYEFGMWTLVVFMHLLLFGVIGWVAFGEHDFNSPKKYLSEFEILKQKHFEVLKTIHGEDIDLDEVFGEKEFTTFLNEEMKTATGSAKSLQELVLHSFNIVLGAFLAFLSATATLIFQNMNKPSRINEDN